MISLQTAIQLRKSGLVWRPVLHDFFAIPDHDMDERVFVISDMLVTIDLLEGFQMISFQGASEWALDSVVSSEAVWLPAEEQLRQVLEELLLTTGYSGLRLTSSPSGYRCEVPSKEGLLSFKDKNASEAYAKALLALGFSKSQ